VQLGVQSHEHFAQPAPCVRPKQAKPLAIAGGRAQRQPGGAVAVVILVSTDLGGVAILGSCDACERRLDLGLAQVHQARTGRSVGGDGGQALLDVAPMGFDVDRRECLESRALGARQIAAGLQMVGQALRLVAGPGLEGGKKGALVDQAVLKSEESEEEMAVGGGSHGMAPSSGGRSGAGPSLRGRSKNRVPSERLSQVRHAFASARQSVAGQR
jgi:hypothetical protein